MQSAKRGRQFDYDSESEHDTNGDSDYDENGDNDVSYKLINEK